MTPAIIDALVILALVVGCGAELAHALLVTVPVEIVNGRWGRVE